MANNGFVLTKAPEDYRPAQNACKLCSPLGAVLAFKGIEHTLPVLHGSQGCATYIRRYLISHFREPVDVASSSFGENAAVFGGGPNLKLCLDNVTAQYEPALIGVASTCLSETMGEDVPMHLHEYRAQRADVPELVPVATPSYRGSHIDGFHAALRAVVGAVVREPAAPGEHINLLPGMASPADLRYLKALWADFDLPLIMLPDYSETLDGVQWEAYEKIPRGGTPLAAIERMSAARATLELGHTLADRDSAGQWLADTHQVPCHRLGLPTGVNETDRLFRVLEDLSGNPTPARYAAARGRLVDAYVDGHKYVSGKRAAIYGEADLVIGLAAFLTEIGIAPVLCATGERQVHLADRLRAVCPDADFAQSTVLEGADFVQITDAALGLKPDLLIGNSKGAPTARQCDAPLIRVGFPVHDRFGGSRLRVFGYEGTQALFDRVVNALIERKETDLGRDCAYL